MVLGAAISTVGDFLEDEILPQRNGRACELIRGSLILLRHIGGIKLYGIVNGRCEGMTGGERAGDAFYAVSYKEISCLVSDATNEGMADKKDVLKEMLNYQNVMERFLQKHTVIPIKFGTSVETKEDVLRVLESGYAEFLKKLRVYEGMMEVDITVAWNDIVLVARKIAEEDVEIKRLKDAAMLLPANEVMAEKIKIGSLIKSAMDRKREDILHGTLNYLTDSFVKAQKQEISDDNGIFNCAFLIEKKGEADFFSRLDRLNQRFDEQLRFKCVSPLPPYAFCTFEVIKISRDEVNKAKDILGVDEAAEMSKMKEIYLKKALDCHPDKDLENPALESRFKELTEAYKVLNMVCNAQKRGMVADDSKGYFYVNLAKSA